MRILLLFLSLTCFGLQLAAQQDLYVPLNWRKAYDKGTRSADGKPGAKYWQNRAKYKMNVSIDPKTHYLSGEATITYTNASPDSLKMIRLKLAHDLYKSNGQRARDMAEKDIDNGVEIKELELNDKKVDDKKQRRANTFLDLMMRENPLPPGGEATIEISWGYRLPEDEGAPRECVCDPTTFFVAYWYPQVAVYDDVRGWADLPYTGQQEFYNDFSDYDVTVTMPRGFQVWATGVWQNPDAVLESTYLDRYKKAQTADEVIKIFTEEELKSAEVYKKGKKHEFRFVASGVPDFAFASSDHYNWDATSVVVDQKTRRRTAVHAAYNTKSKDYQRVARIAADGIALMSTWLPGYPFPYPSETVFNGNDGMEYPMMVNDASVDENFVTSLTVHEVSHTYFPFMMGTNEQEFAWMDEGWAAFFDYNLADSMSHGKEGNTRGYARVAGTDSDVPPMVRTSNLRGASYGIQSYQRPQAAYLQLKDLLGYETFHKCMVEYMDRWKGKHPIPLDFFNTWNDASGQNLNWFWKPWFYEFGYPDLAIGNVERPADFDADVITLVKKGNLPTSIHVELEYSDGTKQTIHQSAIMWRNGNSDLRLFGQPGKTVTSVKLGHKLIPDTDPKNNTWKKNG